MQLGRGHSQTLAQARKLGHGPLGSMDDGFDARVRPLREAWAEASEDLGIRVVIDDCWIVDDPGQRYPLVGLVEDFGGRMHIFDVCDEPLSELAWQHGNGHTVLGSGDGSYDRGLFIEALNDRGWTGDGAPPAWYFEPLDNN